MSLGIKRKFRKGATSFYIVAFSTLILLIVATSFAAIIISEIERTSNDDLSQSAYDSALAGVEDAKLAFYNYQNCVAQGTSANVDCKAVMNYMANPDCDMVGHILGRTKADVNGEVIVQESSSGNNMQQAYTCVKVDTVLDDYRSTLSSAVQYKVVKLKFDKLDASQIKRVKVSWYADRDAKTFRYTNFASNKVIFPKTGTALWATPPTISVALVQTAKTFNYDQFSTTVGNTTNRGMVYLTPVRTVAQASGSSAGNYKGAYDSSGALHEGSHNYIDVNGFLNSNKKTSANTNVPYAVYCDPNGGSDFACSATIQIPDPVGGARSDNTFLMVVAMPYGKPTTDFSLEFFCDTQCTTNTYTDAAGKTVEEKTNQANLNGVQIGVDSTGRANDLYRRIETRLESAANDANLTVMGPLELIGGSGGGSGSGGYTLQKTMTVKCENNFIGASNCT
ncbi:hypothetical protein IKF89_01490 [Candidatus Saccharibacteria bacterium]|nr:hypothetical protein [Candidatus Saccharibacteria bacterium]